MNSLRQPTATNYLLDRLPLVLAAALLLWATWLPVIEIKGFDTFALDTVAMWATRAARVTLIATLLCLVIRPLTVSRWWLALSAGILLSPLADMAVRAIDLTKMMGTEGPGNINDLIVIRGGSWVCLIGVVFWLLDLTITVGARVIAWRGGKD